MQYYKKNGGTEVEVNRGIQSGWKNWKMSGVHCDKKIPPKVKGKVCKMVVQPAILYAMKTVPVTSSQVKKLQVAEMKMCRWECGFTRMDHVRNEDILDKVEVEAVSVRCQKSRFR